VAIAPTHALELFFYLQVRFGAIGVVDSAQLMILRCSDEC